MYTVITIKLQEWHTILYQTIILSVLIQHIDQINSLKNTEMDFGNWKHGLLYTYTNMAVKAFHRKCYRDKLRVNNYQVTRLTT